jgi:hypothetical protein
MLEIISAHLARVELRLWEPALQSRDAANDHSATPFSVCLQNAIYRHEFCLQPTSAIAMAEQAGWKSLCARELAYNVADVGVTAS